MRRKLKKEKSAGKNHVKMGPQKIENLFKILR